MNKNNKFEDIDDEFEYDDDEIQIDWEGMFRKLYAKRKLLIISAVVIIVVFFPLLRTIPKFYLVEVKLAPELSSGRSSSSSLSSIMSSFGLGSLGSSSGSDAIGPMLYPDLMNSKSFIISLFNIPVKSKEGEIQTTYYDYLQNHQKAPIWGEAIKGLVDMIAEDKPDKNEGEANAGALTKKQDAVAKAIAKNVTCDVDKKTGVITIDVKDQDPIICAAVADSTCKRLQEYITEYRSKKARKEMLDVEKQFKQAKVDYEIAKQRVQSYNDSNWDLVEEEFIVEKQDLENKMQLAFQTMSAFNTQLMAARSKYQSSLPVYTVLDGASVPLKPAGPSRMMSLIVILFLVLGSETAWILLKDPIKQKLSAIKQKPEN